MKVLFFVGCFIVGSIWMPYEDDRISQPTTVIEVSK